MADGRTGRLTGGHFQLQNLATWASPSNLIPPRSQHVDFVSETSAVLSSVQGLL